MTGREFLLGAILGYESGPRVGPALGGLEMISRGWHSGVVFGTLSAAAAAGTLYGLDAAGFEDALGMAATQSCGLMSAQFESVVKRMQHGFAARAGLTAAALAAAGYVGIKRVFERDYGGWLAVFGECHHPDPSKIYHDLGSAWETERIAFKAYAAMGLLHAGIAAALQLRAAGGMTAGQVDRIDINMPDAAYGHGGLQAQRPLAPIGAQMNTMYTVAVALLDGAVLIDQFAEDRINRDDVWNLIGRTRTRHHKAYDELPAQDQLTTRVTVTLKDGSTHEKTVAHPPGTGDSNRPRCPRVRMTKRLARRSYWASRPGRPGGGSTPAGAGCDISRSRRSTPCRSGALSRRRACWLAARRRRPVPALGRMPTAPARCRSRWRSRGPTRRAAAASQSHIRRPAAAAAGSPRR